MAPPPPPPPPPVPIEEMDPDYVAESNLPIVLGVPTVLFFLALAFVTARMYVRFKLVRSVGWDDYAMMAAMSMGFAGWVIILVQSQVGLGRHADIQSPEDKVTFGLAGFVSTLLMASLAFFFLKLSIALSLLRMSTWLWYRISIYISIAIIAAFVPFAWLVFFLHCKPTQFHWDKGIDGGTCFDFHLFINLSLVNTAFNISTDVFYATMPIPVIWGLQMKRKVKLYLVGVLSLGYAAVGIGAVKATYQIDYMLETDKTFTNAIQFWGFVQCHVGIIAACAPALKPLVSKALGLSSAYGSKSQGNTNQRAYGYGGNDRRSHAVISGKHMQLSDDYELETPHDGARHNGPEKGHVAGAQATFYEGGDRSGSEEMILGQNAAANKLGIMRTTEIIVK